MPIRAGHVLAYLIGLSSNAWLDLLHELPARVRLALETAIAVFPLVVLTLVLAEPYALAAGRVVGERLTVVALWLIVLCWFAQLAMRTRFRRHVSLGECIAFIVVLFALASLRNRPRPASA